MCRAKNANMGFIVSRCSLVCVGLSALKWPGDVVLKGPNSSLPPKSTESPSLHAKRSNAEQHRVNGQSDSNRTGGHAAGGYIPPTLTPHLQQAVFDTPPKHTGEFPTPPGLGKAVPELQQLSFPDHSTSPDSSAAVHSRIPSSDLNSVEGSFIPPILLLGRFRPMSVFLISHYQM